MMSYSGNWQQGYVPFTKQDVNLVAHGNNALRKYAHIMMRAFSISYTWEMQCPDDARTLADLWHAAHDACTKAWLWKCVYNLQLRNASNTRTACLLPLKANTNRRPLRFSLWAVILHQCTRALFQHAKKAYVQQSSCIDVGSPSAVRVSTICSLLCWCWLLSCPHLCKCCL